MDRARRAMPVSNKITHAKHVQYCKNLHKKRLRNIKPSIDNKPPKKFNHLKRNLKKEQMMEERFAQIERDNRILLSKMSEIMQRSSLDNDNDAVRYSKSLNREAKMKEFQRISAENQAILHRIQAARPQYSHSQWEEEAKQHEKYAENIREYKLHGKSGSQRKYGGSTSVRSDMGMSEYGRSQLEPLDEDYRARSRERLQAATSEMDTIPSP